ncbi:MAG: hypothetical protein HYR50_05945 [Candidatus Rokubacteria bacterium]|nr:hypothetical protein [Candidatus Rokubacteria bacterium]
MAPVTLVLRCALLSALVLAPAHAHAQIFIASRPDPAFAIGPLSIRATVTPSLTPVDLELRWALDIPPGKSRAGMEQDIFLLWPGEVANPQGRAAGDKALAQYVEKRGFTVVGDGRLPLYAQNIYAEGVQAAPQPVGEAIYVTFVQDSHALGLSSAATWIRIPWTPQMANVTYMMSLLMRVGGVIKPRQLHWYESIFTGERHQFSLSFNEVRDRPIFPMYAEHRDRAVRLAETPAELVVHFTHADHLRIEQVYPPTSIRRLSETLESTEVVSLFMGSADGITPQHMTVQFGYFSRLQGLMIVLIPLLLLAAGPALGPAIGRAMPGLLARVRARLHLGASGASPRARGVVLAPETLDHIVPGKTSREDVLRLCGREVEEEERRDQPNRRVLIYRGWRAVPETRRRMRWFATVEAWDIFVQEARIEIERDVVKDVQVLVRRSRGPNPEPPV